MIAFREFDGCSYGLNGLDALCHWLWILILYLTFAFGSWLMLYNHSVGCNMCVFNPCVCLICTRLGWFTLGVFNLCVCWMTFGDRLGCNMCVCLICSPGWDVGRRTFNCLLGLWMANLFTRLVCEWQICSQIWSWLMQLNIQKLRCKNVCLCWSEIDAHIRSMTKSWEELWRRGLNDKFHLKKRRSS